MKETINIDVTICPKCEFNGWEDSFVDDDGTPFVPQHYCYAKGQLYRYDENGNEIDTEESWVEDGEINIDGTWADWSEMRKQKRKISNE